MTEEMHEALERMEERTPAEIAIRKARSPTQSASSREALRAAIAEKHHALNLLAVMHCDGGHYVGKHGFEKACKDAEELRHAMLNENDALRERMQQETVAHETAMYALGSELTALKERMQQAVKTLEESLKSIQHPDYVRRPFVLKAIELLSPEGSSR